MDQITNNAHHSYLNTLSKWFKITYLKTFLKPRQMLSIVNQMITVYRKMNIYPISIGMFHVSQIFFNKLITV